jgi:2-polyprenyl-6-hydroxyphenyl methylase/3-demethylubiquinone-9 3-methyltransferase
MSSAVGHRRLGADEEKCKCCGEPSKLFGLIDFSKSCKDHQQEPLPLTGIPVYYHRCTSCGFIFTVHFDNFSPADFAGEVYNDDYVKVDPDYLELRPKMSANLIRKLFGDFKETISILDYGAGSGRMAEILNAEGFSVQNFDPFTAEDNLPACDKFDLVTSFEVLEHTPNPAMTCDMMQRLVKDGGMLLFSTLVQPPTIETEKLGWWYIGPRNGHISIYTKRSLELLWSKFGYKFSSFNDSLHVAFQQIPEFAKHIKKLRSDPQSRVQT